MPLRHIFYILRQFLRARGAQGGRAQSCPQRHVQRGKDGVPNTGTGARPPPGRLLRLAPRAQATSRSRPRQLLRRLSCSRFIFFSHFLAHKLPFAFAVQRPSSSRGRGRACPTAAAQLQGWKGPAPTGGHQRLPSPRASDAVVMCLVGSQ